KHDHVLRFRCYVRVRRRDGFKLNLNSNPNPMTTRCDIMCVEMIVSPFSFDVSPKSFSAELFQETYSYQHKFPTTVFDYFLLIVTTSSGSHHARCPRLSISSAITRSS